MRTRASRLAALLGVLGALIAAADTVAAVVVSVHQNPAVPWSPGAVLLFAIYYVLPSLAALAGAILVWQGRPVGRALLVAAGFGLAVIGVPTIFTVGYPLLLAALVLLAAAVIGGRPPLWPSLALTLVAVAGLSAGFFFTR